MLVAFIIAIALTCFAPVTNAVQPTPEYWIVFGGHLPRDPVYLLKMDAKGEVLVLPRVVLTRKDFGSTVGAAALAHNGNGGLHLWRWGKDRFLYHALIDKNPIQTREVHRIDSLVAREADTLQVSQRREHNFLLFEGPENQLMAISLGPDGHPQGKAWRVIRKVPRQNDEGCASADGFLVLSNRHDAAAPSDRSDRIFAQNLQENGRPDGLANEIMKAQDIEACDVSNATKTGKRWTVYILDHGTDPEDLLVLQRLDSDASRIGGPIPVHAPENRNEDDQNVAIDPRRKFVVFTIDGRDFGCSGKDVLVYLRLGKNGHPLGEPKLIAGCGLVGGSIVNIDILQD